MRTRNRYLPLRAVEVGMVLGAQVCTVERGNLSVSLPPGHALTEDNLHQLRTRSAEFILVAEADPRSDDEVAAEVAQASARVRQIFAGADLNEPCLASLFEQVLVYRSV